LPKASRPETRQQAKSSLNDRDDLCRRREKAMTIATLLPLSRWVALAGNGIPNNAAETMSGQTMKPYAMNQRKVSERPQ
jgi:hypothetical protein